MLHCCCYNSAARGRAFRGHGAQPACDRPPSLGARSGKQMLERLPGSHSCGAAQQPHRSVGPDWPKSPGRERRARGLGLGPRGGSRPGAAGRVAAAVGRRGHGGGALGGSLLPAGSAAPDGGDADGASKGKRKVDHLEDAAAWAPLVGAPLRVSWRRGAGVHPQPPRVKARRRDLEREPGATVARPPRASRGSGLGGLPTAPPIPACGGILAGRGAASRWIRPDGARSQPRNPRGERVGGP
mmetsp:Transcript_9031/g.21733  ORF Transcript_9031/g.21733 Transcript_9031/m.21733 type:complete len:241 (+) Transcript_9031:52-774(+)